MKVYNTLTRKKEEFTPLHEGVYNIYVCGPTVYNYIHIGNARPPIVFDTLRRYLIYKGNKVNYVQNITDVDDKIINIANEENTTLDVVARRYEEEFLKDIAGLNILPATVHPRATEHITEMLEIIAALIEKGYAYARPNGDVYFRAAKFEEYGKLSHQPLEDLKSGARVDVNEDKEDPMDFALWKGAKDGGPAWSSPYGEGRPGWHIECSAMAKKHLGETIDLHAGGVDLVFPHHENEIAQSECSSGKTFARYWMHNGFINVDNEKMSKSLNNFFMVREVAEVYGYEPIRYLMLSGHYRSPLNYTVDTIEQCKAGLERLYTARDNLDFAIANAVEAGSDELLEKSAKAIVAFEDALEDDLNTPDALAALFDLAREININANGASKATLQKTAEAFDTITGILGILYNRASGEIPAEVQAFADEREKARKDKNWAKSDELRDKIAELGYIVEDTAQGQKLNKKA
jgi:cysteinyl-tRNA synthetase